MTTFACVQCEMAKIYIPVRLKTTKLASKNTKKEDFDKKHSLRLAILVIKPSGFIYHIIS